MEKFNVNTKLLKKQIRAVLESNIEEELKAGIHNLLGEILDNTEEGKLFIRGENEK